MKYCLFILTIFSLNLLYGQDTKREKYKIHSMILSHHSELVIYGATNVNEFSCNYQVTNDLDTIRFIVSENGAETDFIDAHINLIVEQFDCGNHVITSDFKELLKEKKHPHVRIKFIDFIEEDEGWSELKHEKIIGHFEIELEVAGVNKKEVVPVFNETIEEERIFYLGDVVMDINEFGLEAPEKFMGMIKVEDEIIIELKLKFIRIP